MTERPKMIGRYELVEELATGGMAEILLARATGPSGFEKLVVIKRILPHFAKEPEFRAMFLDEARIVAGIRHPNVVQVLELGVDRGELFLAMEYLEGEPLSAVLKTLVTHGERMDHALAAYVVAEVAAGLHAAHELTGADGGPMELVHRDVSPHNIFVGYGGSVKVLDFGIAKAEGRTARTATGQMKGKFEYMSPEQCRGEPLDRRSDIFSLGIVLQELTTNRRLFKRSSELMILQAIAHEPIPSPASLVDGYPLALDAVCRRALARSPIDRYPNAATMRQELLAARREIGGDEDPAAALAASMGRLFEGQIEATLDRNRRARAGGRDAWTDDSEARSPNDVSGLVKGVELAGDEPLPHASPSRRGGRRAWIGLGAATLVIASAGYALRRLAAMTEAHAPGVTTAAMPASPPIAETVPASTTDLTVAADVAIRIETRPPGARAELDGIARGTTPLDLRLAPGATPLRLELRHPGYAPLSTTLLPDRAQSLFFDLSRAERSARTPAPSPPLATAAPPASVSPFRKFP